jgi:hypothetical protein
VLQNYNVNPLESIFHICSGLWVMTPCTDVVGYVYRNVNSHRRENLRSLSFSYVGTGQ